MEEFILNETGELYIRWNINTGYRKLEFNELIASLIQQYKHLGGTYDAFTQTDGKLVGNEKIVIIRNLQEIIQIAIILKHTIYSKFIPEDKRPEDKLKFKFVDEYSFQITHQYAQTEIEQVKSVKDWYNNFFKLDVLKFMENLKAALEDKVVTVEEATGLSDILNQIVLGSAILYDKLMHENLFN